MGRGGYFTRSRVRTDRRRTIRYDSEEDIEHEASGESAREGGENIEREDAIAGERRCPGVVEEGRGGSPRGRPEEGRRIILYETEEEIRCGKPGRRVEEQGDVIERKSARSGTRRPPREEEKAGNGGSREAEISAIIDLVSSDEGDTVQGYRAREALEGSKGTTSTSTGKRASYEEVSSEASRPRGKSRTNLQLAVTKKLLDSLHCYLSKEMELVDVREKVFARITSRGCSVDPNGIIKLVKDHIYSYARALLLYRKEHSEAYSDGTDETQSEPLCVFPPRNRLLQDLKSKYKLPVTFPKSLRVTGRNELLLTFRCFAPMQNTCCSYYPALSSNEELMKLPGFAEAFRSSERGAEVPEESVNNRKSFLWKGILQNPEKYRFDVTEFPMLRMASFPGSISCEEYKTFWEGYVLASLTFRIQEELKEHGLRGIRDITLRPPSCSWMRADNVAYRSSGELAEVRFRSGSRGESVYENYRSPYFLRSQSVCVVRLVAYLEGYEREEIRTLGILDGISKDEYGFPIWTFILGENLNPPGCEVRMQCYPLFRLTSERRRERAILNVGNVKDCILRPILKPQEAQKVREPEILEADPQMEAVEGVAKFYASTLNHHQGEVIRTSLDILNCNQNRDGCGVLLVQGPPGTGKSTTIVSLIGVLLAKLKEQRFRGKKILVCAPSNAAVDVLVRRVLKGVKTAIKDEKSGKVALEDDIPKVLRLGLGCREEALKDVNLERILDRLHPRGRNDRSRHLKEAELLNQADVWFSTLMAVGYPGYAASRPSFMSVIIDEASQAVELDCLLPLLPFPCHERGSGTELCVLVGDTRQLPPYEEFDSDCKVIEKGMLGRLVEYFEHSSNNCVRLQTQYRMHPAISSFPRQAFYSGYLQNDASVYEKKYDKTFHFDAKGRFGPMTFIDTSKIQGHEEIYGYRRSPQNNCELQIVQHLVAALIRLHGSSVGEGTVILSPYSGQLAALRTQARYIPEFEGVSVANSTVDSMQGDEADIIIMTTVRSNEMKRLGFLVDYRRMNVGLTRARYSLIIVGDADTLKEDSIWRKLINLCKNSESPNNHFISSRSSTSVNEFCANLFPESKAPSGVSWEKQLILPRHY